MTTKINSRRKGMTAEQDLARFLRGLGGPWADATRAVATGWRNGTTSHQDQGDIAGTPGLCWQVKNLASPLTGKALDDVWAQTRTQAGVGRLPLLVERRTGAADPRRWWLWVSSVDYIAVVLGRPVFVPTGVHLVRVELGDVLDALWRHSERHTTTKIE